MITRSIALFLLLAGPALADTIHKNDGGTIAGVTITSETLTEVAYKEGRKKHSVPAAEVLSVDYEEMPSLVEEGLTYLRDGDAASGLSAFEDYVAENLPKMSERRHKWAPAFAAYETVVANQQLGDLAGVVETAERMLNNFGDSRYVPEVYLMQAKAQVMSGDSAKATKTLDALAAMVSANELSKRWDLECRLARVRADGSRQGENRRSVLSAILREAGSDYPTVRGRAKVAEGESYLLEAEKLTDSTKSKRLRDSGQRIFQAILKDKASDAVARAGALTGLGDCLFFTGAGADDKEVLKQAAMSYLRVITIYKAQSEYASKSLFYAMRCFELMGDRARARDMKRDLLRLYADSAWAKRQEVARAR